MTLNGAWGVVDTGAIARHVAHALRHHVLADKEADAARTCARGVARDVRQCVTLLRRVARQGAHTLTTTYLVAAVGGVTEPSKMPCYGWSLPAWTCGVGNALAHVVGSTCHACYARRGSYVWRTTLRATYRRAILLRVVLSDDVLRDAFVDAFGTVCTRRATTTRARVRKLAGRAVRWGGQWGRDGRYFRWLDSGDVQSVAHLTLIADIAHAAPRVAFWLPTREYSHVRKWLGTWSRACDMPHNLIVRTSAHMVDRAAPRVAQCSRSAVHTQCGRAPLGHYTCPAPRTRADGTRDDAAVGTSANGFCGTCRKCWHASVDVSYKLH